MRILGYKFFGQDSAVFLLDTKARSIFALSSDRVSRIKKDNYDISPVLQAHPTQFQNVEIGAYGFMGFDGRDSCLETKGTSYYWLNAQRLLRRVTKPKYRSDIVRGFSRMERVLIWLKLLRTPMYFYYTRARDYYWRKYVNGSLPRRFHAQRIDRYFRETLRRFGITPREMKYYDHHLAHATSAYRFSPFGPAKAMVFTLDENGDAAFSKVYLFEGDRVEEVAVSSVEKFFVDGRVFTSSIPSVYSNFTEAMGLYRSSDEGKVEALAAYGKVDAELYEHLDRTFSIEGTAYRVNMPVFREFCDINRLMEVRGRVGDENFCATVQTWLENKAVEYLRMMHEQFPADNLCIAGGAAANVIMNHRIQQRTPFSSVYVVPAMGDEGVAAGAAILAAIDAGEDVSWLKDRVMPYFGPEFAREEVLGTLESIDGLKFEDLGETWPEHAAESILACNIIAVFQGKMEYGPRALGNRSILANAADPKARDKINASVKRRPWYQPLCPAILEEDRNTLFQESFSHKHMATAFLMKAAGRDVLPSSVHVDGTARPQFVEQADNPSFYRILKRVKADVGFGCVINTSFNLHGRAIVHTPRDAITDFLDCNIDELYIEGYRVRR